MKDMAVGIQVINSQDLISNPITFGVNFFFFTNVCSYSVSVCYGLEATYSHSHTSSPFLNFPLLYRQTLSMHFKPKKLGVKPIVLIQRDVGCQDN